MPALDDYMRNVKKAGDSCIGCGCLCVIVGAALMFVSALIRAAIGG